MSDLTDAGRAAIADIAARRGFAPHVVEAMARAVAAGGGTMAQFNIPELGGSGQWMAGGMTMVGDMFNYGLQSTVADLCGELSNAMATTVFFSAPAPGGGFASAWWPAELGSPSASGGQNQMRYAYFPDARRIAVDLGDGSAVVVLDTLDHQIGGFSQQQSGAGDPFYGVSFSSQFGQFMLSSLQRAQNGGAPAQQPAPAAHVAPTPQAAPAQQPAPAPQIAPAQPHAAAPAAPQPSEDGAAGILDTIERLAKLRDAGALSDEEFAAKKAELLARL